ncbi:NAD(P)-dependent oxidoreductase, partial [Gordonia sp. NPDC003585]
AYSVLSQASWTSAGLTPLRGWRAALDEAIAAPAPESSSLP